MIRNPYTRHILAVVAVVAFGLAASAFADDGDRRGGNLTYVHLQSIDSLDANIGGGANVFRIMRQIYDPLVWQDAEGRIVPGIAQSWEISEDGTTYTFHLRDDVLFHDGTRVDAAAVKATFDRIMDPASRSLQAGRLENYRDTEVIDEFVVAMHLTEPFPGLLNNLTEAALSPASSAAVESLGDDYTLSPVAAGPFRVREWIDDNTLVLERFPEYSWAPDFMENQGAAYLDTVTVRIVEEGSTRLLSLETGEADIVNAPPLQDVDRLEATGQYQLHAAIAPGMPQSIAPNTQEGPASDFAVRQAMAYGVDREALIDLVFFGRTNIAQGPLATSTWGYWPGVEDMAYPYDPERAEAVLEEAGWIRNPQTGIREKDGTPLAMRQIVSASADWTRVGEFYQASLNALGFDITVEPMLAQAAGVRYADGTYESARSGLGNYDPQRIFFMIFHSTQIAEGAQYNRSRVIDPYVDELIERGAVETNEAERLAIYEELQRYIMEQLYTIPVYEVNFYHVLQDHVMGFHTDVHARPYLHDVWLDRR